MLMLHMRASDRGATGIMPGFDRSCHKLLQINALGHLFLPGMLHAPSEAGPNGGLSPDL
jgi:hypothetical protein